MRIQSLSCLLVLLLGCSSCGRHKLTADEIERNRLFAEIVRRTDACTIGEDGFFSQNLAASQYSEVREWCAVALGRIGSARSLPLLYSAFASQLAGVRAAAAFAVGEIEDRETLKSAGRLLSDDAVPKLLTLLDDKSSLVQMRAIEALGKVGGHREAVAIVQQIEKHNGAGLAWRDLAITALMRLKDPAAYPVLHKLAWDIDPEIQWRAANALVRLGDKSALPIFLRLLESPNPEVRAYGARGVGICDDPGRARALLPLIPPRDPATGLTIALAIRASAVTALGNLKNPAAIPGIEAALFADPIDDAHPDQVNFALQAASALGSLGVAQSEGALERLLPISGPVANAAVIALARVLKGAPDRFFARTVGMRHDAAPAARAWALALGELGGDLATGELRRMLEQAIGDGATSANASLVIPSILTALDKAGAADLQELLTPFIVSHDPVVLRTAVALYRPRQGTGPPWRPIVQAYSDLAPSRDPETKVAVLDALEPWSRDPEVQNVLRTALADPERNARIAAARILRQTGATGTPDDPGPAQVRLTPMGYSILAGARKDRTIAVIETTKGNIEIELFREDAPITVSNFVSLAGGGVGSAETTANPHGFFDGLGFMRVVPFFVVQGGDPREDQEGGPGYAIRCEVNRRPFQRGSIGMALAGKDTGGSQFFITLAPQPHLDGAYTCFGRVIGGLQVAERIVPGDRIKSVKIVEDKTTLDYRNY